MEILYLLAATLILILLVRRLFGRRNRYIYPPGPMGLPFVGNALQFGNIAPHLKHEEFSEKYGDIHTVTMFGQKSVVLNSMDVVKHCNFDHSDDFNHRPIWLESLCNIAPGIAFRGVDRYKENRRFVLRNLRDHGMGKSELEPNILNEIDSVLSIIEQSTERTVEPHDLMETFSSNVISQMCFSKSWPHNGEESEMFKNNLHAIMVGTDAITLCDFLPFLKRLPSMKKVSSEFMRNVNYIQSIARNAIKDRQNLSQSYDDECIAYESMDLVDDFLLASKNQPSEVDMKNFMQISHDLFEAGTHTTATTLTFSIIQLIHKPKLQEELYEQIQKCLGDRINPEMADMKHMPMVEAFIQEILRMYPIVPLIFHATYRDCNLREFVIPKNTMILINAYRINYEEKTFPYPKEFQPTRWIDDDGNFKALEKDSIITFGTGRRSCLGKSLARMEIFLFLVKLIRKYKIGIPEGNKLPSCEPVAGRATLTMEKFLLKVTMRE